MADRKIKLLGVVGSARKGGNTETVMKEALKAGEQEGAETELIHLVDYNLKPCEGCWTCMKTGNCIIKDDVEKLYEKVAEADGTIIGSPIYYYNVSALTKTFIERVGILNRARKRAASRNKVGGAIVVAGTGGETLARSQILLYYANARMIMAGPAALVIAGSEGERDAMKDTRGIGDARELGRSMVQIARATSSLRGNST